MKLHPEERKARDEVAVYGLRQRLKRHKEKTEGAIEKRRAALAPYVKDSALLESRVADPSDSYLASLWPLDWRESARLEARRRFAFGESTPTPMPADGQRFVENIDSAFRSWRYVRDITRGHYMRSVDSDWYCDSDGHRVGRAIVARLSHGRFIGGVKFEERSYKDSGALFDFRDITSGEETEAAISAARLCERVAEKERDYNEAWQAGAECVALREEVESTRGELLESLAEMRAARKALKQSGVEQLPSVCNAMRSHVRAGLRGIARARKRVEELRERFEREPGFADSFNS